MLKGINNVLFTFSIRHAIRVIGIWMPCFFHLLNRPRLSKIVLLFTFLIFNRWINHTHKGLSIFLSPIRKRVVNILRQPLVIVINFISPTIGKLNNRNIIQLMLLHSISIFIRHILYRQKLILMGFCIRRPHTIKIFFSRRCQSNQIIQHLKRVSLRQKFRIIRRMIRIPIIFRIRHNRHLTTLRKRINQSFSVLNSCINHTRTIRHILSKK